MSDASSSFKAPYDGPDKHVTTLCGITEKIGGGTLYWPSGALALVAPELAEKWIAEGKAEPWPKPVDDEASAALPLVDKE